MAFGLVEGNKLINYTLGQTRVTVIGQSFGADGKTSGAVALYSALIGKPDEGFNPPVGTILARNADMNDLYGHDGQFLSSTLGNYTMQERTASLSFVNDYIYLATSKIAAEISRNTLLNMLAGETFKSGTNTIKVHGTAGNVKDGFKASSEKQFKYLFLEDGKLVVPQSWNSTTGKVITKANTRAEAYSTATLCVVLETLTEYSSTYKEGFRWVYTLPGNITLTENMDFNKISMDCMFLSDARFIEQFYVEGISALEADTYYDTATAVEYTAVAGTGDTITGDLANGTWVEITDLTNWAVTGSPNPVLAVGQKYYVIDQNTGTFKLSTTIGGTAIELGSDVTTSDKLSLSVLTLNFENKYKILATDIKNTPTALHWAVTPATGRITYNALDVDLEVGTIIFAPLNNGSAGYTWVAAKSSTGTVTTAADFDPITPTITPQYTISAYDFNYADSFSVGVPTFTQITASYIGS